MTPLEQEIEKLSKIWFNFVNTDHHKDKDCHWYINQYFSYGQKPYFQASHWGYIGRDFEGTRCDTLEEAQEELRDTLLLYIHRAKEGITISLKQAKEMDPNDEYYWGGSVEEYQRMLHVLDGGEYYALA